MKTWLKTTLAAVTLFSMPALAANPEVQFTTSKGSFTVELFEDSAPKTVANFLRYVNDGSYVGTLFHRVIPGFMVQGGGFTRDMKQAPTYAPIKNEGSSKLKNRRATLAMARTQDPNSATRQFFINVTNNPFLDTTERQAGYAVFGKVIKGEDTIDAIAAVKTTTDAATRMQDVPVTPVIIEKVTVIKK